MKDAVSEVYLYYLVSFRSAFKYIENLNFSVKCLIFCMLGNNLVLSINLVRIATSAPSRGMRAVLPNVPCVS